MKRIEKMKKEEDPSSLHHHHNLRDGNQMTGSGREGESTAGGRGTMKEAGQEEDQEVEDGMDHQAHLPLANDGKMTHITEAGGPSQEDGKKGPEIGEKDVDRAGKLVCLFFIHLL